MIKAEYNCILHNTKQTIQYNRIYFVNTTQGMCLASKCDSMYRICIHLLGLQVTSLIQDIISISEGG